MEKETKLTPEEALQKLMKICSSKEMCSYDLRKKMLQWGVADQEQDKILTYLEKEKFYGDKRYSEAFINDRLKLQKWGRIKIRHALHAKQIPGYIIDELLEETYEESYYENLEEILRRKLRSVGMVKSTQEKKARLYRFAAGRGYESELIYKVLNKIVRD